jgi:hypothetical protein
LSVPIPLKSKPKGERTVRKNSSKVGFCCHASIKIACMDSGGIGEDTGDRAFQPEGAGMNSALA